ncbi:TetR family transcriptional regulator [Streptomyces sp. NPDC090303]|uniref:TetR/AcrR family transcriptional regulator n=1 Tax=Streptomyces sp. NPDC090303 TaxID=3365960 RepID=UPI0037FE17B4
MKESADSPDPSDQGSTRANLLRAARRRFLRDGYHGTSLKVISADAGVTAAVVIQHFGSKEALYAESMPEPCAAESFWEPGTTAQAVVERLLRGARVAGQGTPRVLSGHWHSVSDSSDEIQRLTNLLSGRLADTEDASLRAELAVCQLLGVAILAGTLRSDVLRNADVSAVARLLAPALQGCLDGTAAAG